MQQEQELQLNGNIFYIFFTGKDETVTVRTIPFSQVREIISNPEDAQGPWFYRRTYSTKDQDGKQRWSMYTIRIGSTPVKKYPDNPRERNHLGCSNSPFLCQLLD
jgi:hypothetical protein